MPAHTFSVYDIIKRDALLFPNVTAIVDGEKSITFQGFFNHVNLLASGLLAFGLKPRQRVAVLSMNRLEYLGMYGAVAATGAILVPLNWRLSTDELAYILKDSDARILFCDSTQKEAAYALKIESGFNGALICFDETESLNNQQNKENTTFSYNELIRTGVASIDQFTPFTVDPHDIFSLIYTAAVAGKPRGAALSHSNIVSSNIQTCLTMNIGQSDVYLNMLPLCHITGMNLSLATMHMGGKNVIMEKFNAQQALFMIGKHKVTLMASFPPILTTLMEQIDKEQVTSADKTGSDRSDSSGSASYDLSSLKNTVGIDSPDTILKFREKTSSKFWILYGQSETSGFVTLSDTAENPGSAGRQGCISNMAIVDENDLVLPSGKSGEIAVRGPLVFQGFWKGAGYENSSSDSFAKSGNSTSDAVCDDHGEQINPFDTQTIRNGWHHTGDTGHIDDRGYLWFEGRKPEKELIKPGGENVYPAEVEAVILEHPDIENTCVIGVPDPKFGEGVKAVCVKKNNSGLTPEELIEFVGSRIARYKKPGYVDFVDSLPKKTDGSVDRIKVRELYGC